MIELPLECEAKYFSDFMTPGESEGLFNAICARCDLANTVVTDSNGREYLLDTGRSVFADASLIETGDLHRHYGPTHHWFDELSALKERVEAAAARRFHVCVCLYYKNGAAGMDFHSDLVAYGDTSSIASVSLGAERNLAFRRADDHEDVYDLWLNDGSLLIMGKHCQDRYQHGLLVDPEVTRPRINLTFRVHGWD